jgi:hypothetical protein
MSVVYRIVVNEVQVTVAKVVLTLVPWAAQQQKGLIQFTWVVSQ